MSTRHRCLYIATGDDARDDTTADLLVAAGSPSADLTVSTSDAAAEYSYEDQAIGFGP